MKPKLSVVLPIFNAQTTIGSLFAELIEVLPELTPQFELWIVDDGSTDSTGEAANELAASYPQVGTLHHKLRTGVASAMHTAIEHLRGEHVLFCDEGCPAHVHDIPKLWRSALARDVVVGKLPPHAPLAFPPSRASDHPHRHDGLGAALAIVRRHFATQWTMRSANENLIECAMRKGLSFERVIVRPSAVRIMARSAAASMNDRLARVDAATLSVGVVNEPKRPNFLSRIRSFAFGE